MGRELKFRVWDRKGQYVGNPETGEAAPHMIYDVGVSVAPARLFPQETTGFIFNGASHFAPNDPDFPMMQFTGLKDRDGRDIYEGDIILQNGPNSSIRVIEYWSRGANVVAIRPEGGILLSYIYKTVKVIGNIYENPEMDPRGTNQHTNSDPTH